MLSCVQNAPLICLTEDHNISTKKKKKLSALKSEMELGQVHDIHYWLGYNEGQGNNSQWCLCIDDFKPRTMYLSHTEAESTNKQHSSSTVAEFN